MSRAESPRVIEALAALERAKLRRTPQRLAIVRAFVDDETHPTAQQIFDRLKRAMPTMSFATVYNTLAALEGAGRCRVVRVSDDDFARFDPRVDPHDHAVCDRCGAVRDVAARRSARAPEVGDGFRVRSVERVYRGLCADCAAKRHAPKN
jgi:Fur family peroxide stress response transcriptional regulator